MQTPIPESLNLDAILHTIVTDIRQAMRVDRVVIYRVQPNGQSLVVAESVDAGWSSLFGQAIADPTWAAIGLEQCSNDGVLSISNIDSDRASHSIELWEQWQIRAQLVVPIDRPPADTASSVQTPTNASDRSREWIFPPRLWGLLSAHQCSEAREWQPWESNLLQICAKQIAIAIEQSTHLDRTRTQLHQTQQSQTILKQERDFLSEVLNVAGSLAIVLDLKGCIRRFNQACEQTTGYTVDEVIGQRVWDLLLSSDEIEAEIAIFEQIKSGQFPLCYENYWISKNGTQRRIAWSCTAVQNDRATLEYIICTGIDISDRQQTEAQLTRRARQQEAVAQLGQHALADIELDALMNEAVNLVVQILDVEYGNILELLPNHAALRLVAGVGWRKGLVGQATISAQQKSQAGYTLLCSEPVIVQDLRIETRFSGSALLHQHGVVSGLSAIVHGKNTPFGVLGVHSTRERSFSRDDINFVQAIANVIAIAVERKQAQEELNRFFNLSLDMFCIAGLDGYFKRINPRFEATLGYTEAELLAEPFIEFVHPEDKKATQAKIEMLSFGIITDKFENRYRCKDESYRWLAWTSIPYGDNLFYAVARDITESKQVEERLRQQAEYERLLNQIALHIRQSLNLEEILGATVTEVRQLLKCDRVVVYQFAPDMSGTIVAESVYGGWVSALGSEIEDTCFHTGGGAEYAAGRKRAIANIYQAGLTPCHVQLLERFQVRANLVVPILPNYAESGVHTTNSRRLWGLLIAHQCSSPREWQTNQLDLLDELAVQLSIAIQQSELYQQAQTELAERKRAEAALQRANDELEIRVAQRTAELRSANEQLHAEIVERKQAEAALQRQNLKSRLFAEITLKIRQSLELEVILQTTVTEVQQILACDRVLIYRVWPEGKGRVITEAVLPGWPEIFDISFPESVFPLECQQRYTQGTVRAIADVENAYTETTPCLVEFLAQWSVKAILIVPILQNESLWGFIVAHQCSASRQWTDFEIELMQQLADQVGIALAQAQLLEALQKSERQFRATFEQAAVGIVQAGLDGRFIKVNQKFCEIVGYSAAQVLTKTFLEITHPDDVEIDRQYVRRLLSGEIDTFSLEQRYIRKEGNPIWVNITVSLVSKSSGEPDYFIGAIADISDRKRAEAIQAELTRRNESLVQALGEIVYDHLLPDDVFHWDGEYAKVLGYSSQEIGHDRNSWMSRIHPHDLSGVVAEFQRAFAENRLYDLEYRLRHRNGDYVWVHDTGVMHGERSGQPEYIIGVMRDITPRKQAEEELIEALAKEKELNELKSRFVSMTSHEFRTPLTTILGSAELLKHYSHKWNDEKKLKYLDRIYSTVKHMTDMLDDVLTIGRAEAGKLQFNPQPIDLVEFCYFLVEEFTTGVGKQHQIIFAYEYKNNKKFSGIFHMDERLLRHILGNLLSNAIKYSSEKTTINFELICENNWANFKIEDTGIGIPEEDFKHLYQSFHRAKNVGNIPGTGLGLSIVKKSVELHRGTIEFHSKMGVGTTFIVKFPLNQIGEEYE